MSDRIGKLNNNKYKKKKLKKFDSFRSISLEPEQLRNTGRVALTISAYEGEPRTPTRLDFLPSPRSSRQLSRSSSKASSSTDGGGTATPTPTPVEPEPPIQIGSRLQDELVATLKRSNLREKNDDTAPMVRLRGGHANFLYDDY